MNRLILALVILAVLLPKAGSAATNDFFAAGVTSYREGHFPEAAGAFETSIKASPSVGALVNLGNTEWQRGHAGPAILAWERARWITPFDRRANDNLAFARLVAQVDEPQLKWFEIPSTWLPPNTWVWLAGISLWLAVGAVTLPGLFRRKISGGQQTLAAVALGAFLFCMTANVGVVSRTHIGFVLKKETPLLLTPTHDAEMVTTLNSGEPVRELRQHGDYWLIQTADGTGWIERRNVGFVSWP